VSDLSLKASIYQDLERERERERERNEINELVGVLKCGVSRHVNGPSGYADELELTGNSVRWLSGHSSRHRLSTKSLRTHILVLPDALHRNSSLNVFEVFFPYFS
jgi:hypothetical protein